MIEGHLCRGRSENNTKMDKREKIAVYERIADAMRNAGGVTNTAPSKRVNKLGYRLTPRSMSIYSKGETMPGAETIIGICKALNVSADYVLFGTTPKHEITLADAMAAIDARLSDLGFTTQPIDESMASAIKVFKSLDPETRKKVIELVRDVAGLTHVKKKASA